MKRLVYILLIVVFILTGCQTGIEPNVPSKVTEESVSTDQQEAPKETMEAADEEAVSEIEETTLEAEETTPEAEETTPEAEETAEVDDSEATVESDDVDKTEEVVETEVIVETEEEVDVSDLPVIEAPVIGGDESAISETLPEVSKPVINTTAMTANEVRAIWLSYIDLQPMFASRTESGYKQSLAAAMDNIADHGMNTVMYQVRPFGDALYSSALFPSSYIVTGSEGETLTYDPLEIAIQMAHERGLRIEAWINPYRIRTANSKLELSSNNIASTWIKDGSRRVLQTKEGAIIFNPAIEEVQEYILAGVKEIIDHYAVDGIHFDDYFYPTTDMSLDEIDYLSYQYDADPMSQDVYRRNNVNQLVKNVYQLVHSYNRALVFGISPQGDIETNYSQLYVDIPMWLSAGGFVDYICPQVYYGFEHERTPYESVMDEWAALIQVDVDLIAGLAVYKVGVSDQWAGSGSEEWIENDRMLQRMIETAKLDQHYGGYALFRYASLFDSSSDLSERMKDELIGIEETMK